MPDTDTCIHNASLFASRVLLHENVLDLIDRFMCAKLEHGTEAEQSL